MTIELTLEMDRKLEAVAARVGQAKAECAREAIARYIEDIEDVAVAEARLSTPGRGISQEELEAMLFCGVEK